MQAHTLAPDNQARQQALDVSTSWSVTAPAGSGKTELLTQRILRLLAVVDRPEAVLAITFTRKAAAEMRARILDSLQKAADTSLIISELAPHARQNLELAQAALRQNQRHGWNLLSNPGRLHIQTIDSLCRRLASSLPLESGVSLPSEVVDNPGLLYQTAARRTLVYLESNHPVADSIELLLDHLGVGIEQLLDMLGNLMQSRDSWLPLISGNELSREWLEHALHLLLAEKFADARLQLSPFAAALTMLAEHALKQGGDALDPALDPTVLGASKSSVEKELAAWRAMANFLLTRNDAQVLKKVDKNRGFLPKDPLKEDMQNLLAQLGSKAPLVRSLHRLRELPDPHISDEQWSLIQALVKVITICAAELRLLEQELGSCDHTEVAIAALRALGNPDQPTPLAERLDYRIQHILIDEFQDTSSTQVQLLERLTAGWQIDDGRTLFLVGDAMQSIYEFRKANVELFRRICRQGIQDLQLAPLRLQANFRSRPALVDRVNQLFAAALGTADIESQGFTPALASRASGNQSAIEFSAHHSDQAEAEAIAAHILALQSRSESDIAILVRNRRHLSSLLPVLRKHQIHWQAQEIDPLSGRMAVMDVDSLTRALCCPGDRVAWLSLLRAPWAGLDHADLLTLVGYADSHEVSLYAAICDTDSQPDLSASGKAILQRLAQVLTPTLANLGQLPLRWLVERTWKNLDGPQGLLGQTDGDDIQAFLDLVEARERGGMICDWEAFDQALGKLYARPASAAQNSVQIMTMHKAKGLEFDHVILPALSKTGVGGGGATPLLVWWEREFRDGQLRFLLSPKAARSSDNSLYTYLLDEQKERQLQEQLRILYVAMTRARESLFLSAALEFDQDEQAKTPAKNSLLFGVWETLKTEFPAPLQQPEPAESIEARELSVIRRLSPTRPSVPEPLAPASQVLQQLQADKLFSDRYLSRCVGNILHQDLHALDGRLDDADRVANCRQSWAERLVLTGMPPEQIENASRRLNLAMDSIVYSPTARWILEPRAMAEAESGYAVLLESGEVKRLVIDRTFVEDGRRWVIDYKTAEPAVDEDPEAFFSAQAELYREQLRGYGELFSDFPVTMALYFPLLDELRKIEVN